MRNNVPVVDVDKTKEVVLYILDKVGTVEESVLFNLLYFIDFDFYEKYEEHLMGMSYVKKG